MPIYSIGTSPVVAPAALRSLPPVAQATIAPLIANTAAPTPGAATTAEGEMLSGEFLSVAHDLSPAGPRPTVPVPGPWPAADASSDAPQETLSDGSSLSVDPTPTAATREAKPGGADAPGQQLTALRALLPSFASAGSAGAHNPLLGLLSLTRR